MDGQIVGIRTSTIDEKCQAFDTLVVYCATLGGRFAPYLTQSLELSLPALKFYFHDGVREAASKCVFSSHLTLTTCTHAYHRLIPLLFTHGKQNGTLTSPMVVGIPSLTPDLQSAFIEAINHRLHTIAGKRRHHAETPEDDHEELALLEEVEKFALGDMEKLLKMMDDQHPLPQFPNHRCILGRSSFEQYDYYKHDP